ncbi:MAG: glycine cleavage system aminomethyltransferase GcvT [Cytophagales bacterium]
MTYKVPLHNNHIELGAKMIQFAGFEMPVRYSSDLEEHHAVRNAAGLFDVSHMGEFWVKGDGALAFLQKMTTNDVSKLNDNQIQYSCLMNESGGVVDDLLIYRFSNQKFMLVVNASRIERDWEHICSYKPSDVTLENVSDKLCLFALQGPKSDEIISKWSGIDFSGLKYYEFNESLSVSGNQIIVSATGYTGERGFELYIPNELAENVWKELMNVGKELGLQPIGLGARDTLRLEMGYCLYGHELDEHISPISSGLSWVVSKNKSFLSSETVLLQKAQGTDVKLVAVEMLEKSIPRAGYSICDENGTEIGKVTSGTMSPTLGVGIAMGFIDSRYHHAENLVWISVREKLFKGKLVKTPFVKNTSLRK